LYDLFETRVRFDFELTDLGKVVAALDLVCRWIVAAPHNKWLLIIMVDTGNKCGAQSGYPFQLILFRNANLIIISSFVLAGKPSHGTALPARKGSESEVTDPIHSSESAATDGNRLFKLPLGFSLTFIFSQTFILVAILMANES